nr:hypothetical protein GCM10017606_25030 [Microbacterium terregens]
MEALQVEGYQVLHDYWVKGSATNPRAAAKLEHSERTARRRELPGLMDKLKRERNPEIRRVLHALIVKACASEEITPPAIESIGRDAPRAPDILDGFWQAVGALEVAGISINHSRTQGLLAINLKELSVRFTAAGIRVKIDKTMRDALCQSVAPKFVAKNHSVNSVTGSTVSCWVFEREQPEVSQSPALAAS